MIKVIIQTPTPNVSSSIEFFQKLGFKELFEDPLIFSDGKANIIVNTDRYARLGLRLYQESWNKEIPKLKEIAEIQETKEGYLISDPSGVWLYLIEGIPKWDLEENENSFSTLGNYMGISLESTDQKKSFKLYQTLGFELAFGNVDGGFFSLDCNGFSISIMKANSCPHLFFNPSLTYFNGKNNLEIISKIRSLRIPISEEITHFNKEGIVDNVIIRDPGGLGFFIFND
jgi:hypothetical protein